VIEKNGEIGRGEKKEERKKLGRAEERKKQKTKTVGRGEKREEQKRRREEKTIKDRTDGTDGTK